MKNNKVLFISQEITPYVPETPLSLLGRRMPQDAQEGGYEVRTFMPRYTRINERRNQLHEVIRLSGMNIIIDDTDHPLIIKVATMQPTRMQVYFIDNDDYFRPLPEKELETRALPEDNDERSIFFVRGVIETVKKLRWEPAVIQCTGWITALAPLYFKHIYNDDPTFANSRVIYALNSEAFEGTFNPAFRDKLIEGGFAPDILSALGDGPVDCAALNRLGIDYADAIVVTDPDVPQDLLDYARATGKPMLEYTPAICGLDPDNAKSPLPDFFKSLIEEAAE